MEVNLKIQTLYSMVRSTKISNRGFLILQEMILVMNKSYFTEKRFSSKMFQIYRLGPYPLFPFPWRPNAVKESKKKFVDASKRCFLRKKKEQKRTRTSKFVFIICNDNGYQKRFT